MADLRSVRDRLRWSDRHVATLRELVREYVDQPPFVVTTSRDPVRHRVIYRAEQILDPPSDIAFVFSDALQQLRATLDNTVGALRKDGPTEQSAFVISRNRAAFEAQAHDKLEGVPDWALDHFRELQPFPGNRLGWIGGELSVLHDLARRDRHRALVLQAALVDVRNLGGSGDALLRRQGVSIMEAEYPDDRTGELLFKAKLVIAEAEVASGREVIELLESLADRVRDVVAGLDQIAHARS